MATSRALLLADLIRLRRIRSADLTKADSFFRVPLALGDAIICSFSDSKKIYVLNIDRELKKNSQKEVLPLFGYLN